MNELIKVTVENNQQLVSARDLHRELNIKTRFSLWAKQNFKYFKKEIDFTPVVVTTEVPNNGGFQVMELQDYALTLDMAKHIAMMAGTDKGFEVRDYFIQVEKEWNSPEMIMKRALSYANTKVKKLESRVEQLQPDADYCKNVLKNPTLISSTEIAKRYGWGAVTLHKKLHELGVMYKQGKQWILYAKYSRLGYADRVRYEKGAGLLKWTPKGERFIYNLLKDEGIVPIIEHPAFEEQLELQAQVEYNGPYYTASSIAWNLHMRHEDVRLIGKIATEHRLKPVFVDSNKYCRIVVDEYGRQSYEYTKLGAQTIEQLLELEGYI
jgi:anti-repressor protein